MIQIYEKRHEKEHIQHFHQHSDFQIIYVAEGKGEIKLDYNQWSFNKENLLFIPPNTRHQVYSIDKTTLLCIEFSPMADSNLLNPICSANELRNFFVLPSQVLDTSPIRLHIKKMLAITDSFATQRHLLELGHILLELIALKKLPEFKNANELRAYRIKEYLQHNYYRIHHLNQLENEFHLSLRHLGQIFKESYGITLKQFLDDCRIERSKTLLITTNHAIINICFEVGYPSLATFYRQFKLHTGLSPLKYKNKYFGK
ncbi:helix-turn-helix domain-containing protein [Aerococcaceae bacterium DSM 111020]|nr:helix-turn-helix domain-containing protein [Aerococcaceae bacterium DSM 111020]